MIDIKPYGEKSLIIQFKNIISLSIHQQVKVYYKYLIQSSIKGIQSIIPAYNSITIIYNVSEVNFYFIKNELEKINISSKPSEATKIIEIPVCYDLSLGLDLEEVAELKKLSIEQIVKLHTKPLYTVYMLGFSPGFMYLGGLNPQLFIPRKKTPRLKINAGAVGLADQQTGVYPSATPGGWQIIGQTPISIFSINKKPLVQMGDLIKFTSININTFNQLSS